MGDRGAPVVVPMDPFQSCELSLRPFRCLLFEQPVDAFCEGVSLDTNQKIDTAQVKTCLLFPEPYPLRICSPVDPWRGLGLLSISDVWVHHDLGLKRVDVLSKILFLSDLTNR